MKTLMKTRSRILIPILCLALATLRTAQPQAREGTNVSKSTTQHATGTFEVKIDRQPTDPKAGGEAISRMLLDKQFHGDLEATSKGTMLSAGDPSKGSAGYVALEIVTGTLHGHPGTFVLQHTATMNRGVPQLSVTVVPDSGTGQLTGLTGKMNIIITQGKHSYEFDYTLTETP